MHMGETLPSSELLSIGKPKAINFPFVPNGKLMAVGVLVLKCIRVIDKQSL